MFDIGDVVCANIPNGVFIPAVRDGEVGVIVSVVPNDITKTPEYGVEFFEHNWLRHTLGGLCEAGHGYWMLPEDLKRFDFRDGDTIQSVEREVDQKEFAKILEGDETHV